MTIGESQTAPASEIDLLQIEQRVAAEWHAETRNRTVGGAVLLLASGAAAAGVAYASRVLSEERLTWALPFVETAQRVVNNIDDALVPVGAVALPATLAAVGLTKLGGMVSSRARFADKFSSREPSSDGRARGRIPRLMRSIGMAATGAALATFTSSIATEVTNGPERTIDAFNGLLPGNSIVVQYPGAMTMVQSAINARLERAITADAQSRGVAVHPFSLNLGVYEYNGRRRTDLIAGIAAPSGSVLDWRPSQGCIDIPVVVDKAAGIDVGEKISVNGVEAVVVGRTTDASAINRIGGVMDKEAVNSCLQQDSEAPSFGLVLSADTETANQIVADARAEVDAPAVAISREEFAANSEKFWESNVQPITNVLNLAAGAMAFMAMTSAMGARLLRNRRELASMLANGTKASTLRIAELVRSAKDGLLATAVGITAAVPMTISANALESGFKAGVGVREALIGSALGLVGTVGGAALSLIGLKRVADPDHNTRA